MVIDKFNVFRISVNPAEAEPKLVIHADRILAGPVTLQGLKPVGRRHAQVVKNGGIIEHDQLAPRHIQQISGKALWVLPLRDLFGHLASE